MWQIAFYFGVALLMYGVVSIAQRGKALLPAATLAAGITLVGGSLLLEHLEEPIDDAATTGAGISTVASDMCSVLDEIGVGNEAEAEALFTDRVHGPLHDVARRLQSRDARAAGELLVAKNGVETSLLNDEDESRVEKGYEALGRALDRALERLDLRRPPCLQQEG